MKKIFLSFLCAFTLWGFFLPEGNSATRTNVLPLDTTNYDAVLKENIITKQLGKGDSTKNAYVETGTGTEDVLIRIFRGGTTGETSDVIFIVNIVIGAIAVFWLVFLGAEFVVARGDQEKLTKYKEQFGWIVLGLLMISGAEFIAFDVWDPAGTNDVLTNKTLTDTNLTNKIKQIKLFVQVLIGGIMLIKMMMSGFNLITGSEKEENIQREKTFLKAFFFGGALILMAEILTKILIGNTGTRGTAFHSGGTDAAGATAEAAKRGITEIVGMLNFTLSFIAVAAVVMLVLASLYYVISFGSEDQMNRAKRMIYSSIFAAIISTASFTLVRFVVG